MQTKPLTTEDLAVPGIEVVGEPKGKAFSTTYYHDQLELLRDTLRGMRQRERFVVTETTAGYRIHRKS